MPKESKAVPMLMDKTRHKSVQRLGCHSSTGQFVPFSNALVDFRVYNFVNYSDFECLEPMPMVSMVPLKPWILTVT